MGKFNDYLKKNIYLVKNGVLRFPITVFFVLSFAAICMCLVEGAWNEKELAKIIQCIVIAIPISLIFYFKKEGISKLGKIYTRVGSALCFILPALYYFTLNDDSFNSFKVPFLIISLYIAAFLVPAYFVRRTHEKFLLKVFIRSVVSSFFGIVLAGGISLIYFAFNALLYDFNHTENYAHIWILFFGVFSAIYFFAGLPSLENDDEYEYPKFIKVLISYILIPIMVVFSLVLLGYFIKVLISNEMPKGVIVTLSFVFCSASTVIIYMARLLAEDNKFIKWAVICVPKVVFLFLAMALVAINKRVEQYGITVDRYLVYVFLGLFSVWGLVLNLPSKFKLIIPSTLIVFLIISAYGGPISAYSVSYNSQSGILGSVLEKNNMIENNKIIPNGNISDEDKQTISDKVRYIRGYELGRSDFIYNGEKISLEGNFNEVFGFESVNGYANYDEKYINYRLDNLSGINIDGYKTMNTYYYFINSVGKGEQNNESKISVNGRVITISFSDGEDYTYDFSGMADTDERESGISPDDMTFEGEGNRKIIMQNISFTYNKSEDLAKNMNINVYVLTK